MPLTDVGRELIADNNAGDGIPLNEADAFIEVGDSAVAFDKTHTTLQGGNLFRKGMDVSFPQKLSASVWRYQATFADAEALFDWNEVGLFNASANGEMLCRKVQAMGVKINARTIHFDIDYTNP